MTFLQRLWRRLWTALTHGAPQIHERWVEPGNAITHAIHTGTVGDLPLLQERPRHRALRLDDYPDFAAALQDLEAEQARIEQEEAIAAREAAARAAAKPAPRLAPERRTTTVSTRSARRRRHHHAA